MEDFKKKNAADMNDKEIVFSQSIKAGKRIYYLDVKKNRKDENVSRHHGKQEDCDGRKETTRKVSFEKQQNHFL